MGNERAGAGQTAANRDRQRELYGAPLGDRVRRVTGALGITQGRLARALGLSPAMLSQLVSGRRVKIGDPAVLARLLLLDERCPAGSPALGSEGLQALLEEVRGARLQWAVPAHRWGHGTGGNHPSRLSGAGSVEGIAGIGTGSADAAHRLGGHPHRGAASRLRMAARDAASPTDHADRLPRPDSRRAAADALRAVAGPSRLVAAAAALEPSFPELADVLRRAAAGVR